MQLTVLQGRILNLAYDSHSRNDLCGLNGAGLRQLPERLPEPLAARRERRQPALSLSELRPHARLVENVPLVSWLALRGRCRTCRAWIGWRYPLVELAVGALWAQQTWRFFESLSQPVFPEGAAFGLKWAFFDAAAKMLLYWLLVALAVLDVENLWLPNRLTIPGILSGLGFSIAAAYRMSWGSNGASDWGAGSVFLEGTFLAYLLAIVLGVLLAAGLILLIRWLYWLIRHREGIGLGDAKLMALLAAWLDLPGALLAFGIGIVFAALVAVVLLVLPSARDSKSAWAAKKLPLGTFLCIGGIISSLWGSRSSPPISAGPASERYLELLAADALGAAFFPFAISGSFSALRASLPWRLSGSYRATFS